jgi:hypothetical protein
MMKITIILFLFCLPFAGIGQSPDCGKFRQGRFRIADTRTGVITIADRNSMYQTETSETLKAVVRFRISWQDNCSYTLKLDKVIRNENKINFPPNLEIKGKIVETAENSYVQQTSSGMTNGSYNITVTRIN